MTGYFEKSPGHKSMMRLIAFISAMAGIAVALNAIVLSWIVVLANEPDFVGMIITMFGISGGLFLSSEGFKAMQTRYENGAR